MATPLTADQQMAAYRTMGVRLHEVPGWRSRGMWRIPAKGWEPHGIVIHHTAGGLGGRSVSQYIDDIINGDPAVPDKANVVVAPDGSLWINAAGRANHCLQYSDQAWNGWLNESFPFTGSVNWRGSKQNANKYTYGVECIAAGAPNAAQQETAARWAAAICRAHGWSAGSVCGHGEVADDRDWSDPGLDMGAFRKRVAEILGGASTASTPTASTSTSSTTSSVSTSEGELTMSQYSEIMSRLEDIYRAAGEGRAAAIRAERKIDALPKTFLSAITWGKKENNLARLLTRVSAFVGREGVDWDFDSTKKAA